ncbi:hypothetical protein A2671_00400 [Candidatus Kaiserbacteria bacterium RIFCSPHIGHO2_01_FULL_49_13]|uniref:DNA polymerase III subunit delta n=1 Tax=Candidatus Kaiserbacteria bacterium RIFCSPHIGHO2_01_FULL_49_13 TaxID=1798477 RepID=A0A1F6CDD6_9BACT|nr:MAG: hypothetical protein A2671_00400 [Candidatus Kaiserbacteria bacterium RIFCSPHIGHO2_01_FULL_49_13]
MQGLIDQFKQSGKLHHAILLEGERAALLPQLLAFLEKEVLGIPIRGNPDVQIFQYDTFGIDEGRYVQGLESTRAVGKEGWRIFVICFNFITREAQNAFLKLFEEPNPGTHFFLVTRSAATLLPTLRSRLHIVGAPNRDRIHPLVQKFLKTAPAKRIELFKKILDEKDKAGAITFLNALEVHLYKEGAIEKNADTFAAIQEARGYLGDTGAMMKMLLEYVALRTPVA